MIQRIILRKLFQKIGYTFRESHGLDFVDYVSEARSHFEVSTRQGVEAQAANYPRSKKSQLSG